MQNYIAKNCNEYTLRVPQGASVKELIDYCANKSGEALVKEICHELEIRDLDVTKLQYQIDDFDGDKSIIKIFALYEGFASLSGQVMSGSITLPTFTIAISDELNKFKDPIKNKNALMSYICIFNDYMENNIGSSDYKNVYNKQTWCVGKDEQITEEQATALYNAFKSLNNGQEIEDQYRTIKYKKTKIFFMLQVKMRGLKQ